ncbi:STAS-like domain-containing protein [Flavobacterium sp. CYK-4]|uniref:STAS-like domain-containing protein n=1 Tax=Flavobacterium lotistagni TaxID=2709660 RepID=UPI00140C859D|nr:STAS-like domain-containing protein [Flavobacterium lotistagni]NHM08318.1 STAS-like domain-containing protein [Flavobacterium lotistagni]
MKMQEILIKVTDFTEYPDVRYIEQDVDSGEQYYYEVIKPNFAKALSENKVLVVDLDNTAGYASSFLDEAFGNLVYDFDFDKIRPHLKIISTQEPDWIEIILGEMLDLWNAKKIAGKPRKETK